MLKPEKSSDSSTVKTVTSLTFSPALAAGLFFNTAIIHIVLEFLAASEKIKARDPRTLLNVYRDAPGHVPTQMLHYLNGFYENLWENWAKSAEKSLGSALQIVNNGVKKMFGVDDESDIYSKIQEEWNNYKTPGPNPSPTSCQSVENQPVPNVGII